MISIKLGQSYMENVHNRSGIATALCTYLTGCTQVCLERLDKDGDVVDVWIDITRIEKVKLPAKEKIDGGPQNHPPKN